METNLRNTWRLQHFWRVRYILVSLKDLAGMNNGVSEKSKSFMAASQKNRALGKLTRHGMGAVAPPILQHILKAEHGEGVLGSKGLGQVWRATAQTDKNFTGEPSSSCSSARTLTPKPQNPPKWDLLNKLM